MQTGEDPLTYHFFSSNECINSTLDQQPNEFYNVWLGEGGKENGEEIDFFLCLA